jgi:hypothetical protein
LTISHCLSVRSIPPVDHASIALSIPFKFRSNFKHLDLRQFLRWLLVPGGALDPEQQQDRAEPGQGEGLQRNVDPAAQRWGQC